MDNAAIAVIVISIITVIGGLMSSGGGGGVRPQPMTGQEGGKKSKTNKNKSMKRR
jgi:hypothetical protein